MWNSLTRGLVGDSAGNSYFATIQHLGPYYTPEDTYRGTQLALLEALASGITTVHNWAHNTRAPEHAEASLKAHEDVGLRARFGYGTPQGHPPEALMDLDHLARLKRERFDGPKGLLTLGAALRGPQFGSMDACRHEYEAVRKLGLPISVHVTGNRAMTEKYKVIQTLGHDGLLGPDVQLVHAVHATPQERELIAATRTHLSLSPQTELGAAMGFSPFADMLAQGILVSLSIDTTALPTIADMFAIMRTALNLVHAQTEDAYKFTPYHALELATINGARDLGIDDQVGSLTAGKRADLILLRIADVNMSTTGDTYVNRLVKSARPSEVDTVVVDGRVLKRNGRLLAVDADHVIRAASAAVVALRARAGKS
jgi:cytosine/adenosine deaminase-related metal-dependent hydrolase